MVERAVVERKEDVTRFDGEEVIARGRYRAMPRPVKGARPSGRPKDTAVIDLVDGTVVYLEALDDERSVRPRSELDRFDGKHVAVRGIVRALMPSRGQGLIASCLTDVTGVLEERLVGEESGS